MARTASTWKPGQSGNPSGRPRSLNSRAALRAALAAPGPDGVATMAGWAREMVAAAVTLDDRLSLLKFLDGSQPPPTDLNVNVDAPRIMFGAPPDAYEREMVRIADAGEFDPESNPTAASVVASLRALVLDRGDGGAA